METSLDQFDSEKLNYATFWQRFAALIIDNILIIFFTGSLRWYIREQIEITYDLDYEEAQMFSFYAFAIYLVIIRWCYFAGLQSSPLRATLGKLAVGLSVQMENGMRMSFARATGRYFAKALSGLILSIGFIMAAFTPKKKALHDNICETVVISK